MNEVTTMKVDLHDFTEQQKQLLLQLTAQLHQEQASEEAMALLRALHWSTREIAEIIRCADSDEVLGDEYAQIEVPVMITPGFGWKVVPPSRFG